MILINLANINLRKKAFDRVKTYTDLARKLTITERQDSILSKIENELEKNI